MHTNEHALLQAEMQLANAARYDTEADACRALATSHMIKALDSCRPCDRDEVLNACCAMLRSDHRVMRAALPADLKTILERDTK
jgi:hypothetical protein